MTTSEHASVERPSRPRRPRLGPQQVTISGSLELIQEIADALAAAAEGASAQGGTEVLTSILRVGKDPIDAQPADHASERVAVEELFRQLNRLNRTAAHLQRTRVKEIAARELRRTSSSAIELLCADDLTRLWVQPPIQHGGARRVRHLKIRGGRFYARMKCGPVKTVLRYHDLSLELLAMSLRQATTAYSAVIRGSMRLPRHHKEQVRSTAQRGFWRVTCGIGAVVTAKLAGESGGASNLGGLRALSAGEHQLRYVREATCLMQKRGRGTTSLQSG